MPPPQGTPNPLEGPGDYTMTKTVHSDTYPAIDPASLPRQLLAHRAVYIAGASRGIGKAIALSYARAGAGFIAIGARSTKSLEPVAEELKALAKKGVKVLCVEVDVSDAKSVEAAATAVEGAFGRLDVVVQNAGIFGTFQKIVEDEVEDWWKVCACYPGFLLLSCFAFLLLLTQPGHDKIGFRGMSSYKPWTLPIGEFLVTDDNTLGEVNVKGQFLLAKYFLPLMLQTDSGLKTFVTVASVGAHLLGPGCSQYQTAKLANLRMAEFVDAEYREQGVSAWCVHPGNVVTDMVTNFNILDTMKDSESVPYPSIPARRTSLAGKPPLAYH